MAIYQDFPPPCPACAGATTLKEVFKQPQTDGYMFFFKCLSCAIEYPRAANDDKIDFAVASNVRIPGVAKET
jgi:hypothetical protein